MASMTINEVLALQKMVRERLNEYRSLRNTVAVKERFFGLVAQEQQKIKEPMYNVVEVDKKVAELEKFLFKVDAAIKQSNAVTSIMVEETVDSLLSPLVPST